MAKVKKSKIVIGPEDIGRKFSTRFEAGCVITGESDEFGNFLALDSEGVECSFGTNMIEGFEPSE